MVPTKIKCQWLILIYLSSKAKSSFLEFDDIYDFDRNHLFHVDLWKFSYVSNYIQIKYMYTQKEI